MNRTHTEQHLRRYGDVSVLALGQRRRNVGVRTALERLAAAKGQEETTERAVQTSQERSKAGVTTLIEPSQARARYLQAQSAPVIFHSDLLFQRTALDYRLGSLDPERFAVE